MTTEIIKREADHQKYLNEINLVIGEKLGYERFLVLAVIDQLGKSAHGTAIAKILNKSTNTITTIMDRMESKKLIERTRDTKDRRIVYVKTTKLGTTKFKEAKQKLEVKGY